MYRSVLRVDRVSRQLSKLPKTRLEPATVPDRELLTALLLGNPEAVFDEISESLFVIAQQPHSRRWHPANSIF